MKCPIDDTALVMSERSGVEIDYCPSCRGIWLDRGEIDKIIERSNQQSPPTPPSGGAGLGSLSGIADTIRTYADRNGRRSDRGRPAGGRNWLGDLLR